MAEKDGVSFGTPIDAAESFLLSRKQRPSSRAPRVWEQIVTDDRGRRRLHGAFTGGFSAGYFNTVDTKVLSLSRSLAFDFRRDSSQRASRRLDVNAPKKKRKKFATSMTKMNWRSSTTFSSLHR